MRFRTTQKAVKSSAKNIICICDGRVQHLFPEYWAIAYTDGMYGHNADIYDLNYLGFQGVFLSTGPRPFGNIRPSYVITDDYDKRATGVYGEELKQLQKEYVTTILNQK